MVLVLTQIYDQYKYYIDDARDTRLEHWFLMGSPLKAIALVFAYYMFVTKIGPKFMENRRPFELKRVMIIYNLVQVVTNFILGVLAVHEMVQEDWRCVLVDYSHTPSALYKAKLSYYYYALKVVDLMDTIFFVLRKKYSQVTFLHLYHHGGMVLVGSIASNYVPAGHLGYVGLINCFVHTAMYFYYFLTCIDPSLKSSSGWKKHITQMQMIQFFLMILHLSYPLFFGDCKYPRTWLFIGISQNVFMFVLFSNFYLKTYNKKPKKEYVQ